MTMDDTTFEEYWRQRTGRVMCGGERHRIVLASDGKVSTPDHTSAHQALAAIGGSVQRCYEITKAMDQWMRGLYAKVARSASHEFRWDRGMPEREECHKGIPAKLKEGCELIARREALLALQSIRFDQQGAPNTWSLRRWQPYIGRSESHRPNASLVWGETKEPEVMDFRRIFWDDSQNMAALWACHHAGRKAASRAWANKTVAVEMVVRGRRWDACGRWMGRTRVEAVAAFSDPFMRVALFHGALYLPDEPESLERLAIAHAATGDSSPVWALRSKPWDGRAEPPDWLGTDSPPYLSDAMWDLDRFVREEILGTASKRLRRRPGSVPAPTLERYQRVIPASSEDRQ
jgi:hypothetical protein